MSQAPGESDRLDESSQSPIGRPMPRLEDRRLISGNGRYTNDIQPENACWAYLVRSPHAHAKLLRVDVASARDQAGVLAVLTAADYAADGHRPLPHQANPPDAVDITRPSFVASADTSVVEWGQPPLAEGRVLHVGEAVVMIVAETLEQARDAADMVEVDYEALPAIVRSLDAPVADGPQLWPEAPRNICLESRVGDEAEVERLFAAAPVVVEREFYNQRIVNCQMEPRAAIGFYDQDEGYTVIAGSQGVVRQRVALAAALSVPKEKVRVISPDVGGGFGPRTSLYPEAVLVAWAAKRLGRPVRWNSDRTEAFLTDYQGRDLWTRAAAAFDREGRILAMRAEQIGNLGAYPVSFAPLANGFRVLSTVYRVPAAFVHVRGVMTNTTPTAPYRGAGRPEATFALERLLDLAAPRLGLDRIEIRRRNLIPKKLLPFKTVMGLTYDSGDFGGNMERALDLADWDGFPSRRDKSRASGRLRGIGVANYVEAPVGAARERIIVKVRADDTVAVIAGTQSTGQGHATAFAQVAAGLLQIPIEGIELITGDTRDVEVGGGSHSDRSMRLVGTLLCQACDEIMSLGRQAAAYLLDCEPDEIAFSGGRFSRARSGASVSLFDLARSYRSGELPAQLGTELAATADISNRIPAHPTGCAVCELDVDPETGSVSVQRYTSVDDVGQAINPLIVDGQVHGGIVQGVGQALFETFDVDAGTGQVNSASFMDYCLTRADCVPTFNVELAEDPTPGNPLRIKGGGEGGITPATAAIINALVDALAEYGIEHVEMPATPARVWALIRSARESSQTAQRKAIDSHGPRRRHLGQAT